MPSSLSSRTPKATISVYLLVAFLRYSSRLYASLPTDPNSSAHGRRSRCKNLGQRRRGSVRPLLPSSPEADSNTTSRSTAARFRRAFLSWYVGIGRERSRFRPAWLRTSAHHVGSTFSVAVQKAQLHLPNKPFVTDGLRGRFRFAGDAVLRSPLLHSLWSWRPVVVF